MLPATERLAELHARGVLTEAEFSAKKAELLDRLQPSGQKNISPLSAQVRFVDDALLRGRCNHTTGDQIAGVRPEATRVFGRNAQIGDI
jgi:Short C-terminal domain